MDTATIIYQEDYATFLIYPYNIAYAEFIEINLSYDELCGTKTLGEAVIKQ